MKDDIIAVAGIVTVVFFAIVFHAWIEWVGVASPVASQEACQLDESKCRYLVQDGNDTVYHTGHVDLSHGPLCTFTSRGGQAITVMLGTVVDRGGL